MVQRDAYSRQMRQASDEAEQLRVQLAGCLMASEGATNPEMSQIAEQGDYGWSLAYETTLQLHRDYDTALGQLRELQRAADPPAVGDTIERPSRYAMLSDDKDSLETPSPTFPAEGSRWKFNECPGMTFVYRTIREGLVIMRDVESTNNAGEVYVDWRDPVQRGAWEKADG